MSETAAPRGVRNNNPGNIRRSARGPVWKNEVWPGGDDAFCTFTAPEWGIRAIAITLASYAHLDGCKTIAQAIRRWAPPTENQTADYTAFVAARMKMPAFEAFNATDWATMFQLVPAIIAEECSDYAYPSATLTQGLMLAGLMPSAPPEAAEAPVLPADPVPMPAPETVTTDDLNAVELLTPGAPIADL